MKVETQGSIGAENVLSDNDVRTADGVIIAADKDVDLSRFAGQAGPDGRGRRGHPPPRAADRAGADRARARRGRGRDRTSSPAAAVAAARSGASAYKALMNGVSYMIPFVVVGGLLIAISLSLGGHTDPSGGLVIPKDSFWMDVNNIGVIGFQLMVPILSGYIAYAIGDRPALVPGMIGGWIANTGSLYDSKAGAGFIGAIVTGFLAGYLVLWIKKVKVPKFVRPIMPIIVIPIVATTALGLFFIYVIGKPISWVFEHLTDWLSGMTGTSAVLLGAILGLMIAFDMGGPVNKTAFLFGAGLIATGNQTVMGMCAAAIPVMPLGPGPGHADPEAAVHRAGARDGSRRAVHGAASGSPRARFRSPRRGPRRSSRRTCWAARWPVRSRVWPGSRTRCRTAGRSWRCWVRSAACRCSSWPW